MGIDFYTLNFHTYSFLKRICLRVEGPFPTSQEKGTPHNHRGSYCPGWGAQRSKQRDNLKHGWWEGKKDSQLKTNLLRSQVVSNSLPLHNGRHLIMSGGALKESSLISQWQVTWKEFKEFNGIALTKLFYSCPLIYVNKVSHCLHL